MTFDINIFDTLVSKDRLSSGETAVDGEIVIDDFHEQLILVTNYWTPLDYRSQWIEAIERLVDGANHVKSAFITEMYDPKKSRFPPMCWVMYKEGDKVYVQNTWILREHMPRPFEVKDVYEAIADRETVTDDGDIISEWTTSIAELKIFLNNLRLQA